MNPDPKRLTVFALIVLFSGTLSSCFKENLPKCNGQCSTITLEGFIYDKTTNQPLRNISAVAEMDLNNYCLLFCNVYKVGMLYSGNDGRFTFHTDLDTSLFQDYHLSVTVAEPDNYLLYPEPVGPGFDPHSKNSSGYRFYSTDSALMQNMSFGFFPKTMLKMNFHRTRPIDPNDYSTDLEFGFGDLSRSGWGFIQTEYNKDTTLTINTAANIFTTITVHSAGITPFTDSIKCAPNGNNSIDIFTDPSYQSKTLS